jgi:hypothetical protein
MANIFARPFIPVTPDNPDITATQAKVFETNDASKAFRHMISMLKVISIIGTALFIGGLVKEIGFNPWFGYIAGGLFALVIEGATKSFYSVNGVYGGIFGTKDETKKDKTVRTGTIFAGFFLLTINLLSTSAGYYTMTTEAYDRYLKSSPSHIAETQARKVDLEEATRTIATLKKKFDKDISNEGLRKSKIKDLRASLLADHILRINEKYDKKEQALRQGGFSGFFAESEIDDLQLYKRREIKEAKKLKFNVSDKADAFFEARKTKLKNEIKEATIIRSNAEKAYKKSNGELDFIDYKIVLSALALTVFLFLSEAHITIAEQRYLSVGRKVDKVEDKLYEKAEKKRAEKAQDISKVDGILEGLDSSYLDKRSEEKKSHNHEGFEGKKSIGFDLDNLATNTKNASSYAYLNAEKTYPNIIVSEAPKPKENEVLTEFKRVVKSIDPECHKLLNVYITYYNEHNELPSNSFLIQSKKYNTKSLSKYNNILESNNLITRETGKKIRLSDFTLGSI